MQDPNWNDLKYFLAFARGGSFAAAASDLGVRDTTVSRAVSRLERAMDQRLVLRPRMVLTEAGDRLASRLSDVRGQISAMTAAPGAGVRVSSVPWVVSRVLIPALASDPLPGISLMAEAQRADPGLGETDIALRFARPTQGGALLAQRLASVPFGIYGHPDAPGWIGYVDDARHLPQADWAGTDVVLRVGDLETARAAVLAGLGRAHLPDCIGPPNLRLSSTDHVREVWSLRHSASRGEARVDRVVAWLSSRVAPALARCAKLG